MKQPKFNRQEALAFVSNETGVLRADLSPLPDTALKALARYCCFTLVSEGMVIMASRHAAECGVELDEKDIKEIRAFARS